MAIAHNEGHPSPQNAFGFSSCVIAGEYLPSEAQQQAMMEAWGYCHRIPPTSADTGGSGGVTEPQNSETVVWRWATESDPYDFR